jgi:hypothetical protein
VTAVSKNVFRQLSPFTRLRVFQSTQGDRKKSLPPATPDERNEVVELRKKLKQRSGDRYSIVRFQALDERYEGNQARNLVRAARPWAIVEVDPSKPRQSTNSTVVKTYADLTELAADWKLDVPLPEDRVITRQDVYAVLDEPQTMTEIDARLNVNRSVSHGHLKKLMAEGHVKRCLGPDTPGGGRPSYVYYRADMTIDPDRYRVPRTESAPERAVRPDAVVTTQQVYAALAASGTAGDVGKRLGISAPAARYHLNKLVFEGKATRTGLDRERQRGRLRGGDSIVYSRVEE